MRRWNESTFIFISTNQVQEPHGIEENWIPVMRALMDRGATVRFLCLMHSAMGEWARELGIPVDPYILDKWNVVRSHSRLRKYLRRYTPVCAHSTGLEGDLMLRWAARKLKQVRVAHSITEVPQRTRRGRTVNAAMSRLVGFGLRSADAIFVQGETLAEKLADAGVLREHIVVVPGPTSAQSRKAALSAHLDVYRAFMAGRGAGG